MKSVQYILLLFLALSLQFSAVAKNIPLSESVADVQVVVSAKKILFISDESPVKKMEVQLINEAGETVMQKLFSSKMVDWSLDIRALPAGCYRIMLDQKEVKTFKKAVNRA
jgi:hypothetical protein